MLDRSKSPLHPQRCLTWCVGFAAAAVLGAQAFVPPSTSTPSRLPLGNSCQKCNSPLLAYRDAFSHGDQRSSGGSTRSSGRSEHGDRHYERESISKELDESGESTRRSSSSNLPFMSKNPEDLAPTALRGSPSLFKQRKQGGGPESSFPSSRSFSSSTAPLPPLESLAGGVPGGCSTASSRDPPRYVEGVSRRHDATFILTFPPASSPLVLLLPPTDDWIHPPFLRPRWPLPSTRSSGCVPLEKILLPTLVSARVAPMLHFLLCTSHLSPPFLPNCHQELTTPPKGPGAASPEAAAKRLKQKKVRQRKRDVRVRGLTTRSGGGRGEGEYRAFRKGSGFQRDDGRAAVSAPFSLSTARFPPAHQIVLPRAQLMEKELGALLAVAERNAGYLSPEAVTTIINALSKLPPRCVSRT